MKLDFLRRFDFFVGVPDSQLKPLCNGLMQTYGIGEHHLIAADEGNALGIAARENFGRPTASAKDNKNAFMQELGKNKL